MSNICENIVKIHCEDIEVLRSIYKTIHELDENTNKWGVRLCELLDAYGIDWQKEHIPVRGNIYYHELDERNKVLDINYESAWCPMDEVFDAINEKLGQAFVICRRSVECGCGIFSVRDSQGDFPEECLVSAYGGPFGDDGFEQAFDTISQGIEYWCEAMNISRDGRSDEEMLEFIEGYEYECEDCYYYINQFEFE